MPSDPVLFDTHVHLDADPFSRTLQEVVRRARMEGVSRFLIPGVRLEGWSELLHTARAIGGGFAAPGLHPASAGQWSEDAEAGLRSLLGLPEVVAVGEIGLDGSLPEPEMTLQEEAFRGQLRLAIDAGLPVLIHCRKAMGRMLDMLRAEEAGRVGGILHAFSGSLETALQAVELGFALGFGGPLTYPNARRIPEVLGAIPAEAIVLETDAPDMTPHPHRGEPNRPEYLGLIARKAAEVRGWSLEETARITTANALRVLKIGETVRSP